MALRKKGKSTKITWEGTIISIQPRIRLMRVFNERNFIYPGYTLLVDGTIGGASRVFSVGIGKNAASKLRLQKGLEVRGESLAVKDTDAIAVEFSHTSRLEVVDGAAPAEPPPAPPWIGLPPDLPTYRDRGPRRLDAGVFEKSCTDCIWGCNMAVEISTDPRVKTKRVNRFETFCYGPKSCSLYEAGACRMVPFKNTQFEELDSVDHEATAHRGPDE